MRALLRFTLPSMGIWMSGPILSLMDTSVIGLSGSGDEALLELAALTPATALSNSCSHLLGFLAVSTTMLVARARACGDDTAAQAATADAVTVAAAVGVVFAALFVAFATPALAAFSGPASAALVQPAATYTRIRGVGFPCALVMAVGQAACLACQDTAPPVRATALAAGVNLVGDALLVLGLRQGIAGAAWATVASQAAAAAVLLLRLLRPGKGRSALLTELPLRPPSAAALLRFARLGLPVGASTLIKVAYFTAVARYATALSPTAAASHSVMFALFSVLGVLGSAVSQAAQSFMPACIGTPRAAWVLARRLMRLGAAVGLFNCCAIAAAALLGHGAFTSSPQVVAGMRSVLGVACATLLLHNCSMATEGMCLAGGEQSFLLRANALGAAVATGTSAWAVSAGWGLSGVWLGILVFHVTRITQNGARLLSARSPLRRTAPMAAADA